jgi:hypothetical protein
MIQYIPRRLKPTEFASQSARLKPCPFKTTNLSREFKVRALDPTGKFQLRLPCLIYDACLQWQAPVRTEELGARS